MIGEEVGEKNDSFAVRQRYSQVSAERSFLLEVMLLIEYEALQENQYDCDVSESFLIGENERQVCFDEIAVGLLLSSLLNASPISKDDQNNLQHHENGSTALDLAQVRVYKLRVQDDPSRYRANLPP